MLSVQTAYPPLPATVYTPHNPTPTLRMGPRPRAGGRPNLSLKLPSLALQIPPSAMSPSTPTTPSSANGMMSPTTRNTLFNKRITAPRRTIIEVTSSNSDSESDSDSEMVIKREENRMRSAHHPVTPRTGFFPGFRVEKRDSGVKKKGKAGRRVGFSEDVVVYILAAEKEEEKEDAETRE